MTWLAELRAITPPRQLTNLEAHMLAERQAITCLRLLGITEPPVPSLALTSLPFLKVACRTPMQSSGASKWIKSRWVILLNGAEPSLRQRFSLAHELKHVIDHRDAAIILGPMDSRSRRHEVERLCDYFAGCLLAPRTWLKAAYGNGIQNVVDLAELFDVSIQAMQVRLLQCGLLPVYDRCGIIDNSYLRAAPVSPLIVAA